MTASLRLPDSSGLLIIGTPFPGYLVVSSWAALCRLISTEENRKESSRCLFPIRSFLGLALTDPAERKRSTKPTRPQAGRLGPDDTDPNAGVSTHAFGFCGTPSRGEVESAANNALLRASSALAPSRVCEQRYATRRPYDSRATRSIVRWVLSSALPLIP
jgi:hypothetical protein